MKELSGFASLGALDSNLCVLSTLRPGGGIQSTVVNAGVVEHPLTGHPVVAFIADAGARKVVNLLASSDATLAARAGWNWTTVEGRAEVVGADGEPLGISREQFRVLVRDVTVAAVGGAPEDWQAHVDAMALDEHVVVLISPVRVYSGTP